MKIEIAAMKSNKITAEEQDAENLGKLCSERKACGRKRQHCLSGRRMCALHICITYVRVTGIEV